MTGQPSLQTLERLVAARRNIAALHLALNILQTIDTHGGRLDGVSQGTTYSGTSEEDAAVLFATRFAAAFGRLLIERDLEITAEFYEQLLAQHRWIDLLFSLSGFRSSDIFLNLIAEDKGDGRSTFEGTNILRLLAMHTMYSFIDVDIDQFWHANPVASAVAFLNYISSRYVFSRRGFEFREILLQWLPPHLAEVNLGTLTLARLPEIYMHCSYAFTSEKHTIKRVLTQQIRRACIEGGVSEATNAEHVQKSERPTIVVVGERLTPGHVIYRTHSRAVRSLRKRFHVVGLSYLNLTDAGDLDLFDESITAPVGEFIDSIRVVAAEISARRPALIFYPSIGMSAHVIALSSLRLAPIQCASYGHMATTMSPAMDYMIFPEDFVGSARCFSEKILALPKTAMPFAPRAVNYVSRQPPDGTIRAAIPASTMKLNPVLFDVIARIGAEAKTPVEFHFFPLAATGLPYFELSRIVRAKISRATVHPQLPHDEYMWRLGQCELFLCPFPYGNTNGIVNSFQLGLPGICLDGEEAHAHTDAALFARINLPNALTAKSLDEYATAAITLIDNKKWRARCTQVVRTADLDDAFFAGDTGLFCSAIEELIWPRRP